MDQNPKILFILCTSELGGAERQAILLAREIKEKINYVIEFVFLIGDSTGTIPKKLDELSVGYHFIKWPFPKNMALGFLYLIKYTIFLRRLKPAILMPYTTYPNILTSLVWKQTQARLCIWNQRDEGIALFPNWYTRKAIANASNIIANSASARDSLTNLFNIKNDKVAIVYNGVEPLKVLINRDKWRRKYAFDSEDRLICMVSNLSRHKDHETLLRSFKLVKSKYLKKPVKLLLAGRFDENYNFLLNLSIELNITEDIFFLGKIDDIGSLLNAVDLSVLSSFSEGLPNVILESMLSGVPITGSRIKGMVEVLGDDYIKYLAAPGDYHELTKKILFFLENPTIVSDLLAINKKRAMTMFSLDNLFDKTAEYLFI